MYMTRPLSSCRSCPSILAEHPNDGPFSGFLVITDREAEEGDVDCFGSQVTKVKMLPLPQDRVLATETSPGESQIVKLWFIPVLDQPLSSDLYYVFSTQGDFKGKSETCSREEDKVQCCFSLVVQDMTPRHFNPRDIYQQFKIQPSHHRKYFEAQSIAPEGFPPRHLRHSWVARALSSYQSQLLQALGLDTALRARLPDFNFSSLSTSLGTSVLVGKWYCPFVFIREEIEPKEQMRKSMFYTMTLEQRWERIYFCENLDIGKNTVNFSSHMQKETISVFDMDAEENTSNRLGGFSWFQIILHEDVGRKIKLGLSSVMTEKIRWIQREGGWIDDGERDMTVEKVEEFKGSGSWVRFGCYILVEIFKLRRLDGRLVLKWEFRHIHKIRCKWE